MPREGEEGSPWDMIGDLPTRETREAVPTPDGGAQSWMGVWAQESGEIIPLQQISPRIAVQIKGAAAGSSSSMVAISILYNLDSPDVPGGKVVVLKSSSSSSTLLMYS